MWGSSGADAYAGCGSDRAILHFNGWALMASNPLRFNNIGDFYGAGAAATMMSMSWVTPAHHAGCNASHELAGLRNGALDSYRLMWWAGRARGKPWDGVHAVGQMDNSLGVDWHYAVGRAWTCICHHLLFGFVSSFFAFDVWVVVLQISSPWAQGSTIIHFDGVVYGIVLVMASRTSAISLIIWGMSANDIYVAGGSGAIVHFDGSNWTRPHHHGFTRGNFTGVLGGAAATISLLGSSGCRSGTMTAAHGTTWTMIVGTRLLVCGAAMGAALLRRRRGWYVVAVQSPRRQHVWQRIIYPHNRRSA